MRLLLFLFLSLVSRPAFAGQHAVYVDPDGKRLMVDVADDGSARFLAEGEQNYGLWRDGQFYIVNRDEGPLTVMRINDLAAAADQVAAAAGNTAAKPPDRQGETMRVEPKGQRRIAGHDGQVFAVFGILKESPGTGIEFVTTREPALQALGRAMEQFMLSDMILAHDHEMAAGTRAIFATGAPLDLGGLLVLASLETSDVPAAAVALPAEPETIAEIVAALKAGDPEVQAVDEPMPPPGET
ncbi:MAG: hypothetical protein JWN69_369 [Alphaproteobacteria bacterium]|nr:hypothetical protein [Alphaproteobacteria bacterium]